MTASIYYEYIILDIELSTLRKQYDQRVKPSVEEVREFPDIDKIKKRQKKAFIEEAKALRERARSDQTIKVGTVLMKKKCLFRVSHHEMVSLQGSRT